MQRREIRPEEGESGVDEDPIRFETAINIRFWLELGHQSRGIDGHSWRFAGEVGTALLLLLLLLLLL